jgi:hypothetical protein
MGFYLINDCINAPVICEGYVDKVGEDTIGWRHHILEENYISGDLLTIYKVVIDEYLIKVKLGEFIDKLD